MTDTSKREELIRVVQAVTWNASNYPPKIQPHVLGQDIVPLTMKIVDAVEALFEQAHTPSDDERGALIVAADALVDSWDRKGSWSPDSPVGMVMQLADILRRYETTTGDERTPEFEALEQDLFKHQPVLSMSDGHIAGCPKRPYGRTSYDDSGAN